MEKGTRVEPRVCGRARCSAVKPKRPEGEQSSSSRHGYQERANTVGGELCPPENKPLRDSREVSTSSLAPSTSSLTILQSFVFIKKFIPSREERLKPNQQKKEEDKAKQNKKKTPPLAPLTQMSLTWVGAF